VSVPEDNAVVSALIALGYRRTEAEAAAAAVADSGDEAAQVRAALQRLRQ
jgi:Holliday junction resolvasome RuvABC DNA-binding subunit